MFTDFLGVMLINLAAGLAVLAHYLYEHPKHDDRRSWAAGFFAVGILGFLTALPMVLGWPLPGSYNVAFGGPALFVSTAFLAGAVTLTFEWEPLIPAIYGAFGGIYAVVVGLRLLALHLTQNPTVAFVGYCTAGIGGIFTLLALNWRQIRWLAWVASILLGISAIVWAITGYLAIWGHIAEFAKYVPPSMAHSAPAK